MLRPEDIEARKQGEAEGWTYSGDGLQRWKRRVDGSIDCESVPVGDSLTSQEFKDDCDVNVILKRLLKTGQMPVWNSRTGVYGDFSEMGSYQEAMETIVAAEKAFMAIPAEVRLKFDNDPQKMMDYLADPKNNEEAVALGLKVRPPVVSTPAPKEGGGASAPQA